jgi:hypothetical protein
MSDHPIIFKGWCCRAIQAGLKSTTLRPIKPEVPAGFRPGITDGRRVPCTADDRLWVRESWSTLSMFDGVPPSELDQHCFGSIRWAADGKRGSGRLRSAIHLPKRFARLWLGVESVRPVQLGDLTIRDALDDGVQQLVFDCMDKLGISVNGSVALVRTIAELVAGLPTPARDAYLKGPGAKLRFREFTGSYFEPAPSCTPLDLLRVAWWQLYCRWDPDQWVWQIRFKRIERPEL